MANGEFFPTEEVGTIQENLQAAFAIAFPFTGVDILVPNTSDIIPWDPEKNELKIIQKTLGYAHIDPEDYATIAYLAVTAFVVKESGDLPMSSRSDYETRRGKVAQMKPGRIISPNDLVIHGGASLNGIPIYDAFSRCIQGDLSDEEAIRLLSESIIDTWPQISSLLYNSRYAELKGRDF